MHHSCICICHSAVSGALPQNNFAFEGRPKKRYNPGSGLNESCLVIKKDALSFHSSAGGSADSAGGASGSAAGSS